MKFFYAKIMYEPEGVFIERKFKDEKNAVAFIDGFMAAKGITFEDDEDSLEDYYACVDDKPAVDE